MVETRIKNQDLEPGFIRRPDEIGPLSRSSKEEIDEALEVLERRKDAWVELDLAERIAILDQIRQDIRAVAEEWVSVSTQAKGTHGNAYAEAEEWAFVGYVLRNVRLLSKSLRTIRKHGRPLISGPVVKRMNGQIVARVFPQSLVDRLMLPGTTAEVWMQPGITVEEMHNSQARFYTRGEPEREGGAGARSWKCIHAGAHRFLVQAFRGRTGGCAQDKSGECLPRACP